MRVGARTQHPLIDKPLPQVRCRTYIEVFAQRMLKWTQAEMDATGGITATKKTLDTLKSIPTWLLVGLSISLLSMWLWPPFLASLPESLKEAVPMALVVAAILTGCKLAASGVGHVVERRGRSIAHDRERLLNLYRPLATLFLTRHVTVCTGIASPYLRHWLESAWAELGVYRRRSVGLKRAWRALFDRQTSSSAEVEFGGDFPLQQVIELVKKKAEHADTELFRLINRADRSHYEEPDRALLTDEEFALFEHIDTEHRRLSARVGTSCMTPARQV